MNQRLTFAVAVLLTLAGCAAVWTPRQPLPIKEVVNLCKSGNPQEATLQRLRNSGTSYALRGSDYGKLKAAGCPDPVLDYLQQRLVDDVDLLTRYWVLGEGLGGCHFCYPQPVDLDSLQSGYGAVASTPPGRYGRGMPPGTPDWVPASLKTSGQISIDDILQMHRNGISEQEIVQKISNSRLTHVVGVGGFGKIRTQPVAGVSGSLLAQLREQGVSAAVLDAIQSRFLAQFIEAERLRYQNWGKGPNR